jgi:amino acid permease
VTGVIGSGVLSLPWSIAQLGWIVGPFSILLIASSTLFSAFLLCNTYRSPNPEYGPHRSASYLDVVNFNLGNFIYLHLIYPFQFSISLFLQFLRYS